MSLRMLIVDDSLPFRELFKDLLMRVGFDNIIEASDCDEAIEKYRAEKPEIIFIDMIMPGKSGVETTRELLKINPKAVIIAISSIINKILIKEALDAGAKDFLFKPTNEMALEKVIQMWGRE